MKKKALLVISFGTSHLKSLENSIQKIEEDFKKAFPERDIIRVFTSNMIRKKLERRDGMKIFSPSEALEYLKDNGYEDVIIQSTHIIPGSEYTKITDAVETLDKEMLVKIGRPLLYTHEDFIALKDFFNAVIGRQNPDKETAVLLMGHGTDAKNNLYYPALDYYLNTDSPFRYFVATVEGYPEFPMIKEKITQDYSKVVLMPLMVVAGEHVKNDMLNDKDSWKNQLEEKGIQVEVLPQGLGEYPEIRDIFIEHARE